MAARKHTAGRRRFSVALVAATVAITAVAWEPVGSEFDYAVRVAAAGSEDDRLVFARAALSALIDESRGEIQRQSIRDDNAKNEEAATFAAWQAGVYGYIATLERVADELERAITIEIYRERDEEVRLLIDDQQVMVSATRVSEQERLEALIAAEACVYLTCDGPTPNTGPRLNIASAERERRWVFAQNARPRYEYADGLQCIFEDHRHLNLKRAACERLMAELRQLAQALRAVELSGERVDWNAVRIGIKTSRGEQTVVYNRAGRTFNLRLPNLYAAASVWQNAIPWLRAHNRGVVQPYAILAPDRLAYLGRSISRHRRERGAGPGWRRSRNR